MTLETRANSHPLFDPPILRQAVIDAFKKLDPRTQLRNPVMFIVLVGAVLTTMLFILALIGQGEAAQYALSIGDTPERAAELSRNSAGFIFAIAVWLWFTVLFANFAEAMAEGRGKAQADTLRKARRDVSAKKLSSARSRAQFASVPATVR